MNRSWSSGTGHIMGVGYEMNEVKQPQPSPEPSPVIRVRPVIGRVETHPRYQKLVIRDMKTGQYSSKR